VGKWGGEEAEEEADGIDDDGAARFWLGLVVWLSSFGRGVSRLLLLRMRGYSGLFYEPWL